MKTQLVVIFSSCVLFCSGQSQNNALYDLTLPYKPATIKIFTDTISYASSVVNNVQKITYIDIKPGYYKIQISGPGQPATIRDSIIVSKGQKLVLSFTVNGPCLYDHPAGYIPVCPKNHKDNIISIVYGLVATNGDKFIKNKMDMKVKYAGCLTTDCDPLYYCKEHDIEF